MRRHLLSLVCALSCVVLVSGVNLLLAQQGNGHGSSHGGGGHAAGSGTTITTLSNHSPAANQLIYPTPIGLQRTYSGYSGINRGALPTEGRHGGERGYGRGGAFPFVPYYYSTFDNYSTPYASYDGAQDQAAQNAGVTANLLGEQVQRLSSEVAALRQEREAARDRLAEPISYLPAAAPEADAPVTPPVTLVLVSGKQIQLKSYAVMGREIWDFSAQPVKKIAVSNVNLSASRAMTEANGAEFPEIH